MDEDRFLLVMLLVATMVPLAGLVLLCILALRKDHNAEGASKALVADPLRRPPIFRSCLPPEEIERLTCKIEEAEASLESEETAGERAALGSSTAWSTPRGLLGFPGSILLETRFEEPASAVTLSGDDGSIRFLVVRATFKADAGKWGMLPLESYPELQSWISGRALELCRVDGEEVAHTRFLGGARWGRFPPPIRLERDYVCEFWLPYHAGILHRWRVEHDVEYRFHLTLRYQHHSGTSEPFLIPGSWSVAGGAAPA